MTGSGIPPGRRADLAGTIHTSTSGERYISADLALQGGFGTLRPLLLANRYLGGADWFYNPSSGAGQRGVLGGFGLNNIGMLVVVCGRVTAVGADYLYLDDGSGLPDGTETGSEANVGVRVYCSPIGYAVGDYLSATGISSCFDTPGGSRARCVRTRGTSDLVKY